MSCSEVKRETTGNPAQSAQADLARLRVGLLGPSLPYRGGVAQYTTALHRALGRHCNLQTVSFRRLYPNWLYPGKSCIEPGYSGHKEPGILYLVDSLNPVSWRKACRSFEAHSARTVILEWWTAFHAPSFRFMAEYLERKGIGVVALCHNVFDHESAWWHRALSRAALSKRKAFLVHSSKDAAILKSLAPGSRIEVHAHPVLDHFRAEGRILPRRAGLELLFFGFVRPYKGLDVLIDAMKILQNDDVFLSVVGEWWSPDRNLRDRIGRLPKVEVVDGYAPEEEAAAHFRRADVVVLPYRSATGSGVIPLAYRYGKPVIASRVGGIPDHVQDRVSGLLVEPENPVALAAAIREFLREAPVSQKGILSASEQMTFESLAACILAFSSLAKQT